MKTTFCFRSWALLLALAAPALHSQSTKAELFGVVRDPGGLPVAEAKLDLVNAATETKLSTESDTEGSYHFFALPPGNYEMVVAKNGFSTLRRGGIVVRVGDQVSLDLALRVGDVSESVEVTAAAPLLQSN